MRRWTIAGSLALIASMALGMAALRDSEGEWAEVSPMAALGLIAIAVALVILRKGRAPALAAFAIVASVYLVASWPIGRDARQLPLASPFVERVVLAMDAAANPEPPIRFAPDRRDMKRMTDRERELIYARQNFDTLRNLAWTIRRRDRLRFGRKIAHSWIALALGSLAATAAALLAGRALRYDRYAKPSLRSQGDQHAGVSPGSAAL